jgi:replicative DNA helicase
MIYDENFGWIKSGVSNPTLFIATEQDIEEIQTLALAFLSNVNEAHILDGKYEEGEEERINKAAEILANSPLYVKECPDFSIRDIENIIKKEIREHDVKYIVFDYLQTSMKILEEITKRSGGVRLREDNILFMFSSKLKDICNLYGVFILTGTQLSAEWRESKTPDQNLLRGAKAIADKVDYGSHILPISDEDLQAINDILGHFPQVPNNKISVYKNRRGAYKGIYLWCYADLGTCRVKPMFATDWNYNLISIDDIRIELEEEQGAF